MFPADGAASSGPAPSQTVLALAAAGVSHGSPARSHESLPEVVRLRLRPSVALALAAVCLSALGLRLVGLGKLQPYFTESDWFIVQQMQFHRAGLDSVGELPHSYFAYPTMLARALAWIGPAEVDPASPPAERLSACLRAASSDFVRVRLMIALLSSLLVPATFLLARRFLGDGWALLAAALVATSLLHLLFSQQARPHGAQATLALLSVLASLRIVRRPDWSSYLLATACAGLSLGTLHSGVFVLAPILAAHLLADRSVSPRAPRWSIVLPFLAAGAAFWCFYPTLPTVQEGGGVFEFGGHTLRFAALDGSGMRRVARFLWEHDPVLLVLGVLGLPVLLAGLARRGSPARTSLHKELAVVVAYALPYSLALLVFGEVVDRMLLPLLPFLAVLVAGFARSLARLASMRVRSSTARRALAGVWVAVVLFVPVLHVARFMRVSTAPDTFEQAAAWIEQNLDPSADRVVLSPRLSLPLLHSSESLSRAEFQPELHNLIWMKWQLDHRSLVEGAGVTEPRYSLFIIPGDLARLDTLEHPDALGPWLAEIAPGWAVIEVSSLAGVLPQMIALRERLRALGPPAAVIRGSPSEDCWGDPIDFEDNRRMASRIRAAEAFGPCLEIYRMPAR